MMNKLQFLFAFTSVICIASCGKNKNPQQGGTPTDIQNAEAVQEPGAKAYSAYFTINNKPYQCTEVGAVSFEKTNEMVIHANSEPDSANEVFDLTFTIKGIGTGIKQLDTAGNYGVFTDTNAYTYETSYTDDCTNSKSSTNCTIALKSLKDYTPEADGFFQADFDGQMMRKYEVPSYPCANGTSTNKKIEFIHVKGSLKGSYINTKSVPL
jgi:hypothetical protein